MLNPQDHAKLADRIRPLFRAKLHEEALPAELEASLSRVYLELADWVHTHKTPCKPLLVGVNGAQGSGKSTLCTFLQLILTEAYAYQVAVFSIDDIYLTHAERERLGREIHPLLVTRGVPGTHDVALGQLTLDKLIDPAGGLIAIPAFDKAFDDRRPPAEWPSVKGPVDIVLFEGWCVGAKPQAESELVEPVNALERDEDRLGIWRAYVNRQLRGPYAELFNRFNRLVMLKVPSMDCVYQWRSLQEQKLTEKLALTESQHRIMDAAALQRFIMHYERLTRHILAEMPSRADLILLLDEQHQFVDFRSHE